jgi:esterase/lipase superfamily enzyme
MTHPYFKKAVQRVLLFSLLVVPFSFVWPIAKVRAGAVTAAAPEHIVFTDVRKSLERHLGLERQSLKDDVDLIQDLQLDRSEVYYAVLAVYNEFSVNPPKNELTKVRDIAGFIEKAKDLHVKMKAGRQKTTSYVQTVFFATNRNLTGESDPEGFFGTERVADRKLKYGVAEVNIPFSHKRGQIETPWLKYKIFLNLKKHIYMLNLNMLPQSEFFSSLSGAEAGSNEILVYVHGFNVSFNDAILRAGQISFDFGFKGSTIAFSWPSNESWSPLAYNADWGDVLWSVKYIKDFLSSLKAKFPGRKIHIVAHSMGNKGVLHAMRLLAVENHDNPLFENVVLCAPDFDAGLFAEQIAPEIQPLAANLIVYASQNDSSLIVSKNYNGTPRLGAEPLGADAYQIIDASKVEVTPWSVPETHSYYATKKRVIDDMIAALKGIAPDERSLSVKVVVSGKIWYLE